MAFAVCGGFFFAGWSDAYSC